MNANEFKQKLVDVLAENPSVKAIAQTGDLNAPLIPGKSDMDLFVLCDAVPTAEQRRKMYEKLPKDVYELQMGVSNGGIWDE